MYPPPNSNAPIPETSTTPAVKLASHFLAFAMFVSSDSLGSTAQSRQAVFARCCLLFQLLPVLPLYHIFREKKMGFTKKLPTRQQKSDKGASLSLPTIFVLQIHNVYGAALIYDHVQ